MGLKHAWLAYLLAESLKSRLASRRVGIRSDVWTAYPTSDSRGSADQHREEAGAPGSSCRDPAQSHLPFLETPALAFLALHSLRWLFPVLGGARRLKESLCPP